jgi:hypothetical protein
MTHGEGKEIGFSVEKLHQVAFDSHVWDYGSRLQFYVMHENELSKSFQENEKRKRVFKGLTSGDRLICVDAQDVMGLTEGKVYTFDCAGEEDGLVVVLDDNEEMKDYFFERFMVKNS